MAEKKRLIGSELVDCEDRFGSLIEINGILDEKKSVRRSRGQCRPLSTPRKQAKNVCVREEGRTIPLVVDSVVCADSTVVVDVAASLVSVAIEGSKLQSTTSWYVSLHETL